MQKRIMVVDDSRVVHLQIEKMLENTSYEVVACFRDGENAIDQYDYVQPDLVTMDIIMPGMDGLETARILLQEHPEANIVMLSSLVYDDTINEATELGAKGFIYKPFEQEQLLAVLDQVLGEAQ